MTGTHVLRVVWPIHDDAMFDAEAIAYASLDWPALAEKHQVTALEVPRYRVVQLDEQQQRGFNAKRAVVCGAPVIKRTPITSSKEKAA